MQNSRKNADLFFIDYKRLDKKGYVAPITFAVLILVAVILLYLNIIANSISNLILYAAIGVAVVLIIVGISLKFKGVDKTQLPTAANISALLTEDISNVKSIVNHQFSPDFAPTVTREFVVHNQCHEHLLGFKSHKKKVGGITYATLNKISVISFGESKMQIHTQIVDLLTGIDIMQKTVMIPYDEITHAHISYENNMDTQTVRFTDGGVLNKNQLLPKLSSAVKNCKEILRLKTKNPDNESYIFNDILVADYELFYTQSGLYKNVYTINEGKELEKEILRRCNVLDANDEVVSNVEGEDADAYNFVDDATNMAKSFTSFKWN